MLGGTGRGGASPPPPPPLPLPPLCRHFAPLRGTGISLPARNLQPKHRRPAEGRVGGGQPRRDRRGRQRGSGGVSLQLFHPCRFGPSPPLLTGTGGAALRPFGAQSRIVGGFMMQHFGREEGRAGASRSAPGVGRGVPPGAPRRPTSPQPIRPPAFHPRRAGPPARTHPQLRPAPSGILVASPPGSSRRSSAGCLGRSRASASSRRRRGGSTQAREEEEEESHAGRHAGKRSATPAPAPIPLASREERRHPRCRRLARG